MGSTNTTTYYNLSQFVGTDKPAWLQDYNGDMLKIDTGINGAKVAADNAANAASAAQGDATTALGGVSSLNTTVGTLSNTVGTAVGNINTINSLIGNGTPTTTDQTIIGAINEINAQVVTPVQKRITVTADGVKTYDDLFEEILTAVSAITKRKIWLGMEMGNIKANNIDSTSSGLAPSNVYRFRFQGFNVTGSSVQLYDISLRHSDNSFKSWDGSTFTDMLSDVPANNTKIELYYLDLDKE